MNVRFSSSKKVTRYADDAGWSATDEDIHRQRLTEQYMKMMRECPDQMTYLATLEVARIMEETDPVKRYADLVAFAEHGMESLEQQAAAAAATTAAQSSVFPPPTRHAHSTPFPSISTETKEAVATPVSQKSFERQVNLSVETKSNDGIADARAEMDGSEHALHTEEEKETVIIPVVWSQCDGGGGCLFKEHIQSLSEDHIYHRFATAIESTTNPIGELLKVCNITEPQPYIDEECDFFAVRLARACAPDSNGLLQPMNKYQYLLVNIILNQDIASLLRIEIKKAEAAGDDQELVQSLWEQIEDVSSEMLECLMREDDEFAGLMNSKSRRTDTERQKETERREI